MTPRRWLGPVCGLGAAAVAATVTVSGGRRRPGYSHLRHYISELGEVGAPDGRVVSLGGFLPVAVLSGASVASTASSLRANRTAAAGVCCFGAVALSYGVAALAPCDPGCPHQGELSARQAVHNAAGALGYLGGGAGLVVFGVGARRQPDLRRLGRASLAVAVPYAGALVAAAGAPPHLRGLAQRCLDAVLLGWLAAVAVRVADRGADSGTR